MELFDTHAHLLDERFDIDRDALITSLAEKGIVHVLEACCCAELAQDTIALSEKYDIIYASLGTHPHEVSRMEQAHLTLYKELLSHKKVVAIGEIGLDYHYDFSPRDVQKRWFIKQLELAIEHKLPVLLHVREAFKDALDILKSHKDGLSGVMHCFSGSYEVAKECLDLGLYIAFGGALTFHNARRPVEIIKKLPLERLLIETDCPYMTPEPLRGKRNDPSMVRYVCERAAELLNISADEAARITLINGRELFKIQG